MGAINGLRTVALGLGVLVPGPALAEDNTKTAKWGSVEGWDIRVDRSAGNGCFAMQVYEDGTSIRLGFDLKKKSIYFMLGNVDWRSLELGKLYSMQFSFDDQRTFNGELRGVPLGGQGRVFLEHSDISYDFAKAFMERSYMRVRFNGATITKLSLKNTYAAVTEVANCQREISGSSSGGSAQGKDPFSNSSTRDPFAR